MRQTYDKDNNSILRPQRPDAEAELEAEKRADAEAEQLKPEDREKISVFEEYARRKAERETLLARWRDKDFMQQES